MRQLPSLPAMSREQLQRQPLQLGQPPKQPLQSGPQPVQPLQLSELSYNLMSDTHLSCLRLSISNVVCVLQIAFALSLRTPRVWTKSSECASHVMSHNIL